MVLNRSSHPLAPLAAASVVVLFLLPLVAGRYPLYLTIQILILSVFSLGFNLLFGYTGLLSFGQAGFFAVGASYKCYADSHGYGVFQFIRNRKRRAKSKSSAGS